MKGNDKECDFLHTGATRRGAAHDFQYARPESPQLNKGGSTGSAFTVQWDGRDANGELLPNGTYFYELRTPDHQFTHSMLSLK